MIDTLRRRLILFSPLLAGGLLGQVTSTTPGADYSRAPVTVGGPSTLSRKTPQAVAQDHEKNLEDLDKLATMVKELKDELENSGPFTLPAPAVKNADQIQKLAKKVYDRLKAR